MNTTKIVLSTAAICVMVFVFLSLIKALNVAYPISITTETKTNSEISVSGVGKVDVVPDTATVDVGISVNNAATVDDAQKKIDTVNNKIIEAMKLLGIEKKDIRTSNYSIYPNYTYSGSDNKITGYNGNVNITITSKNLNLVSKIIEESTKAGANQIQGSRFIVAHPEKYREQARDLAIANAKEQAAKMAKTLGINLGKVSNIIENSGSDSVAYPVMAEKTLNLRANVASSADMEPGTQTVTSNVTLFFEK
ncbi:SIMPL domain-containing protein [Candidatus Roizmanbacteria bacterium]|nr:SIMPL domain-containing protein [Candidatus Roizmanbacteria bacterium]